MTRKGKIILAAGLLCLFFLLIAALKTVDVAHVEGSPEGTEVGLAGVNGPIHEWIGMNMTWYRITEILGYAAILTAACFAGMALVQLIQRRSLKRVDPCLVAAMVLYAVCVICYVLFNKVVINYRPVLMPGETEAEVSFPSSHSMVAVVIMGSTFLLARFYAPGKGLQRIVQVLSAAVAAVTVIGRLLSGVHWFTDIVGGVLLSAALISAFNAFVTPKEKQ